MLDTPSIETAGRDEAVAELRRKLGRGYLMRRLRQWFRLDTRTAASVRRKYDRIAGAYREAEEALTTADTKLSVVNGEVGFVSQLDLLEYRRSHLAYRLDRLRANSIIETGAGELSTLIPVVDRMSPRPSMAVASDISDKRLAVGTTHNKYSLITGCVAANAAELPFASDSCDVVLTHHCLEQSPTLLKPALLEFARVARKYVVLVEPAYELAHDDQRKKLRKVGHGVSPAPQSGLVSM